MPKDPNPLLVTMPAPPESVEVTVPPSASVTIGDATLGPATSGVVSASQIAAYIGRVLDDRYILEEPLGEGGMGIVYRGRHKVIDKRVAVKILRGDLAADREMTDRFLNEARAASSIGNAHIVDISDFGRLDDGSAYFVMEYLDGQSLAHLMADLRVVPVGRIIHVAKQVARGLAAAHARGIVHRDLKPDNVMLVERGEDVDFVKILDFGIAKVSGQASKLTRAGSVFGTPHYMSPEQAAGTPVDLRTDIYSLGIIIYEMASGKVPFDADNFMGILTQHMYRKPVHLRDIVPTPQEIPVGLDAIVYKCLAKNPAHRYQTMEELVADLDRAEAGHIPNAVSEGMARSDGFNVPPDYFRNAATRQPGVGSAVVPATPFSTRRPILLGVLGGAALLVAVVVGVGAVSMRTTHATEEPHANASAAPAMKTVLVTVDPIDAVIAVGGRVLGPQPQSVEVGTEPIAIRVTSDGYKTLEAYTIDGNAGRVALHLEKDAPLPPAPATAQAPRPDPAPTWRPAAHVTARPVAGATPPKPSATASSAPAKKCPQGQRIGPYGDCENELR